MKTTPKTKRDFTPKQMEFLKDIVAKCMTGKWEIKIITGLQFKPVCSTTEAYGKGWLDVKDITIPYPLYEKLAYELKWVHSNYGKDFSAFTDWLVFTPEAVCKILFDYEAPTTSRQMRGA